MWWFRASVSSLQCSVLLSKTKFEEIFCIHHYWVKHCLEPLSSMFCTVIKDKNRRVFCNQHYCVKNYLEPLSPMICSVIKDENRRDFLHSTLLGQELLGTALSGVLFCYKRPKSKIFFVFNIIWSRITWNRSLQCSVLLSKTKIEEIFVFNIIGSRITLNCSLQCSVLLSKTKIEEFFVFNIIGSRNTWNRSLQCSVLLSKTKIEEIFCSQHYLVKNYLECLP